jgi:aminoglycoside 3-N-acetyltransferase I
MSESEIEIGIEIRRLGRGDAAVARRLFVMMAEVFEEESRPLADAYLERLLAREGFWALGAFIDGEAVGGVTAHTLPMTRAESSEIFIYDIAVRADKQRLGIGRRLIAALRDMAAAEGIHDLFVPADDEDTHALEFYRALGATGSPVTFFVFAQDGDD